MAYVVHRYRRQYRLTVEEQAWVDEWKTKELPLDAPAVKEQNLVVKKPPVPCSGELFA